MDAKLTKSALVVVNFTCQLGTMECPDFGVKHYSGCTLGIWVRLPFKSMYFK